MLLLWVAKGDPLKSRREGDQFVLIVVGDPMSSAEVVDLELPLQFECFSRIPSLGSTAASSRLSRQTAPEPRANHLVVN